MNTSVSQVLNLKPSSAMLEPCEQRHSDDRTCTAGEEVRVPPSPELLLLYLLYHSLKPTQLEKKLIQNEFM